MFRILSIIWFLFFLFHNGYVYAQADIAETAQIAEWNVLKKQPVTEKNFREVCDLLQKIGKNNLNKSYSILSEYVPMVQKTHNRRWVHILLMGWAKAKESLSYFSDAEKLYQQARQNAGDHTRYYREAVVGTALMYLEWGKKDSLNKYLDIGERESAKANDNEDLSFIYTFKAMSFTEDTASMHYYIDKAIALARNIKDKNALFTALFDYAITYCQYNPVKQVIVLDSLLELAKDTSLNHHTKLYERTDFTFRNPAPSVYYELMQVDLMLTDYDNAWKFAELFYDATVKPDPGGVQAPYFDAEMAITKVYQGDYAGAEKYLQQSKKLFNLPEKDIPYISYFIAAGMIAEHDRQYQEALNYYSTALKKGNTAGLYLMPPQLYYAHALILMHNFAAASRQLDTLRPLLKTRKYSAIGYYYYKYYSELLKSQKNYPAYAEALETFYDIKDSLTNITHYLAIQEIETKIRIRDKEQQIARLNEENAIRAEHIKREDFYFIIFITLSIAAVLLLIAYAHTQYLRRRQAQHILRQNEKIQQSRINQMEKQHRIDIMQGMMDAEENERHKIADQLHDEVGTLLSLMSLNVSSTLEKGRQDEQAENKLAKTQELISDVSVIVRELSHQLTPLMIEKYGFRKAIENLAFSINLSEKIKLETIIVGFDDTGKYSSVFLNNLYRIIQELLHNIIKHAQSTHAILELVEHTNHIALMVEDNGVGIDEDIAKNGKSLHSIRSKIAYLNGKIEITSKKENGTLIVVEIPA